MAENFGAARVIAHVHERRSGRSCGCVAEAPPGLHSDMCNILAGEIAREIDRARQAGIEAMREAAVAEATSTLLLVQKHNNGCGSAAESALAVVIADLKTLEVK